MTVEATVNVTEAKPSTPTVVTTEALAATEAETTVSTATATGVRQM